MDPDKQAAKDLLEKHTGKNGTLEAFWEALVLNHPVGVAITIIDSHLELRATGKENLPVVSFSTEGCTPLIFAAHAYRSDVLAALLALGANVGAIETKNRYTAFLIAIREYDFEAASLLLQYDPPVINAQRKNGDTALHLLVESKVLIGNHRLSKINLLLSFGADPCVLNDKSRTPFHCACEKGLEDIVEAFCNSGADCDMGDRDGRAPLLTAALESDHKMIKFLLRIGANVNVVENDGDSPLHLSSHVGDVEGIKLFVAEGIDVNARNKNGDTPLLKAIGERQFAAALSLIDLGAHLHARNYSGKTLYHIAAEKSTPLPLPNDFSMPNELIDSVDNFGNTALHYAARRADEHNISYLVQEGANTSITNNEKMNALDEYERPYGYEHQEVRLATTGEKLKPKSGI